MTQYLPLSFRNAVLATVIFVGVSAVLWVPAIPQDPDYHRFADQRSVYGVSHFFNVISNLPFIAVGVSGLLVLFKTTRSAAIVREMISAYRLFFAGIIGVGIGSIYYHLEPSNETLIWDRMPMTVSFMAFFSIILAEYISAKLARWLFYPLVLIGVYSVVHWYLTELNGQGDLRLYGLIQFLPLLLMPLILVLYRGRFSNGYYYWLFFALYALAKVSEAYDAEVYRILPGISGHTLKHLLAALGCAVFLVQIKQRRQGSSGVS